MTSKMHTAGDNLRDPGLDIKSSARSVSESGSGTISDDYWLQLARDAWTESEDYFDANVRDKINKSLAHFNNQHADGSKYYSDQYRFRVILGPIRMLVVKMRMGPSITPISTGSE